MAPIDGSDTSGAPRQGEAEPQDDNAVEPALAAGDAASQAIDGPAASELAEAERRVRVYLRSLGLQAAAQGPVVETAMDEARVAGDGQGGEDVPDRALSCAMGEVGKWFDDLAASVEVEDVSSLRAQLPWLLRPVLREHPDAFGQSGADLPEAVREAIAQAARPILPPLRPTVMERQLLGGTQGFWGRLRGYGRWIRRVVRFALTGRP